MFPCSIKKFCYLSIILFSLGLVSACGQKGDLYHPDEKPSASVDTSSVA